ncbi:MAG TPA: 4-coumarate--CoA ligase family protein [Acidimicrobiales bacterium]|nr:4-coumarate--CoA ligase family protein [Acidimicrobiales bacterium]
MIIHRSPLPDVEIPDTALTEYVLKDLDALRDRPALIDGPTGRTYTFGDLDTHTRRLAGGLLERGMKPGEVLAIMAPNIPEYAIVFHGVARAGGTVTTINPTYTAGEVRHQLQDAGATRLVTVPAFLDTAREAIEGTDVSEIYVIGEAEGVPSLTDLYGEPVAEPVPVEQAEHVVVLPYSSGTTGLPKGVMLTHRNLVANIAQCEPILSYGTEDEVALAVLPFFHIYGMQVLMNALLSAGVTVVTMPRFDLKGALDLIRDRKVTRFFAVPPIILALAKHPLVDEYDLSGLRGVMSGAAPLGAELAEEAAERIGCEVVQGYGMTELSPVSHATPYGAYKAGSSGITAPNTECRVVDTESGEDLGVGEEGELWIRGPQVMKGYLNNPEATAATIDEDGWLHTGDVARIDEEGHVFVVDRVKELIKYKGFQVPPAELEALIVTHPAVADVAVIGIPDVEAGELPKAFIVLKEGHEATAEEIQEFVAGQVAGYKKIRMVEFIDEIPKSASGKILRRFLRDQG